MKEIKLEIPQRIVDEIYIALLDSYERLQNGKSNIKRCLNYLEDRFVYEPPKGYIRQEAKEILEIREMERKFQSIGAVRKPYSSIIKEE